MMSHVLADQGRALEASRATLAIRSSEVEMGARHEGLCDPLAMETTEACCGMCDSGLAH